MCRNKILEAKDIILNFLPNNFFRLTYIIESANWSIKQDGKYITENLNKLNLIKSKISTTSIGIRGQIIHFGSVHTFLREGGFLKPHKSNRLILTWFHFDPEDKKNKNIIEAQKYLDTIHTSSNITRNNLINLGLNPEKIVVIPLGVDLSLFKLISFEEKQKIKEKLKIPLNKIVIGSFQKDGVGWGKGLEPKFIKGPDIFVKVVEKLAKNYPIFVLLVGPARGCVKSELIKRGVAYKNIGYLKDFSEVAKYYNILDLYLITSRIEGGPKQILEAWASGIPVVSTKVGMIPDIVRDGTQALLAEINEIESLVEKSQNVIENKNLREKLIKNGVKSVKCFSWEKVAKRYYNNLYANK